MRPSITPYFFYSLAAHLITLYLIVTLSVLRTGSLVKPMEVYFVDLFNEDTPELKQEKGGTEKTAAHEEGPETKGTLAAGALRQTIPEPPQRSLEETFDTAPFKGETPSALYGQALKKPRIELAEERPISADKTKGPLTASGKKPMTAADGEFEIKKPPLAPFPESETDKDSFEKASVGEADEELGPLEVKETDTPPTPAKEAEEKRPMEGVEEESGGEEVEEAEDTVGLESVFTAEAEPETKGEELIEEAPMGQGPEVFEAEDAAGLESVQTAKEEPLETTEDEWVEEPFYPEAEHNEFLYDLAVASSEPTPLAAFREHPSLEEAEDTVGLESIQTAKVEPPETTEDEWVEEPLYPGAEHNEFLYDLAVAKSEPTPLAAFREHPSLEDEAPLEEEPLEVEEAPALSAGALETEEDILEFLLTEVFEEEDILEFPLTEVFEEEDILEFPLTEVFEEEDRDEESIIEEIITDEESMEAEILTPEKNRMPLSEDYFQLLDEKGKEAEETGIIGILRDIRIEFSLLKGAGDPDISLGLFKRTHPMAGRKGSRKNKEADVEVYAIEETEDVDIEGGIRVERIFSVDLAEAGIYTFIVENEGRKAYEVELLFRLYERKEGERIKEYGIELSPYRVLKFKFILPEAVFWDDEDFFTGTVEGPDSVTKFNEETGLIWKEEKNY
jgi:hypothetical protein